MAKQYYNNVGYSLNQSPLNNLAPYPIVAKRAPTTADTGYAIGQIWIFSSSNEAFILTSVVSNSATWLLLESGGGAGVFSSLVVNGTSALNGNTVVTGTLTSTGATTLATTGASTNTFGNTTGATSVGISAGTGGIALATATTGAIGIQPGTTGAVNIGTTGTGAVNIGNTTGNTAVVGSLTASTSLTATAGNITATNGNIVLSTATNLIQLPGPVNIMSGAGAPAAGLALHVGDMYINTTGSTTSTRLYIATAAGTWTYIASNA